MSAFDLLLVNARVATMDRAASDRAYGEIEGTAQIGIKDGNITFIGFGADTSTAAEVHDVQGKWVTPGLIDCHTHIVYGGNRAGEWEIKLKGATYEEVAKAGGGIVNTVTGTRNASMEELVASASTRVEALLAEGVTTLEIKSGYGLELDHERKQLRAAETIGQRFPVRVIKTFLGAHAVPREFAGRADEYVDEVVKMLPPLHAEGLVDAVDAFCESIGFTNEQTARVFDQASHLGLPIRLHGDQLHDNGGGSLVARYKGLSCDHCEYLGEESVKAMATGGPDGQPIVAVLLPTGNYFIKETQKPPTQLLRDHNVPVALATNCNPGSSPCSSLLLALNMGCTLFGLTPEEALLGVTLNAARALGLHNQIGSISVGKRADLCVWELGEAGPCELAYYLGLNRLRAVYYGGKRATLVHSGNMSQVGLEYNPITRTRAMW